MICDVTSLWPSVTCYRAADSHVNIYILRVRNRLSLFVTINSVHIYYRSLLSFRLHCLFINSAAELTVFKTAVKN